MPIPMPIVLTPDAPGGGAGGDPGAAAPSANAGITGGGPAEGPQSGAAPVPATPTTPATPALEAADDADPLESIQAALNGQADPGDEDEGDDDTLMSNEQIDAMEARATASTAAPATPAAPAAPAAPVAAAPVTPATPAAPAPVAAEPAIKLDDKALDTLIEEVPETKAVVEHLRKVAEVANAQALTNKALQDRLDKLEAGITEEKTKAAEVAKQREHYETNIAPVLKAIDSIEGLDQDRYGRPGGPYTQEQWDQRAALDVKAKQYLADLKATTKDSDKPAVAQKLARQAWAAAHNKLGRDQTAKAAAAPTTKAKVIQEARRQSTTRSPAGIASGANAKSAPVYSDNDSPEDALTKVFASHGIPVRR